MKRDLNLLTAPLFLAGLLLLLANDFLLKFVFHNALTGKLSDFAGLFVFPFFWAVLAPRRRLAVYLLTAAGFVFWKSSSSEPLIDLWNSLGLFGVRRAVDPTDLFALVVLPLSSGYLRRQQRLSTASQPPPALRRFAHCALILLSLFAFTATQRAGDHMIAEEREYEFRLTRDQLLRHLRNDIGLDVSHHRFDGEFVKQSEKAFGRQWSEEDRNQYSFRTPTKVCNDTVYAAVTLHQKGAGSALKVGHLTYNCNENSPERTRELEAEAVRAFERDVIEKLRALAGNAP